MNTQLKLNRKTGTWQPSTPKQIFQFLEIEVLK